MHPLSDGSYAQYLSIMQNISNLLDSALGGSFYCFSWYSVYERFEEAISLPQSLDASIQCIQLIPSASKGNPFGEIVQLTEKLRIVVNLLSVERSWLAVSDAR